MGCGAPVIPVVGLAFVGLSSGTLALLAVLSRAATSFVFIAVALGVVYLGWLAGGRAIKGGGSGAQANGGGATIGRDGAVEMTIPKPR